MREPALFQYLNPPSGVIFSCHAPDKSLELEVCQVLFQRLWHLQGAVSAVSHSCRLIPGTHLLQVRCGCHVLSGQSRLGGTGQQHGFQQRLLTLLSILHLGLALMGVAGALCQTVFSSFIITVRKVCKK